MKSKLKPFCQYIVHDIDVEDFEKADLYLDEALPLIGYIVMYFNSLESSLDHVLCEHFTDRSDSMGLIVLNKMNFSSKVDLLKRFCDDFHICVAMDSYLEKYEPLINDLNESGRLRNLVVHAQWENTDEEGYTYVRLKMSKKGMQQEYVQFDVDSLQKLIKLILYTQQKLDEYWEIRNDVLYGRLPNS